MNLFLWRANFINKINILITGGSGFIGTNLINELERQKFSLLNVDISKPRNNLHSKYWEKADICVLQSLKSVFANFKPTHVVHLAARTDLYGRNLNNYSTNILGVENIIKAINNSESVNRCIFTSSMLVCKPGYIPQNYYDYKPSTLYGVSKVEAERIIQTSKIRNSWTIIRPTSIWGPWFGEPYYNFFNLIMRNKFYKPGNKLATKTFGYVGNTVYQIKSLLFKEDERVNSRIFYIGDKPALNIGTFADEILHTYGHKNFKVLPYQLILFAAWFGDLLKILKMRFPITTFRLNNMTKDNILDSYLDELYDVVGEPPFAVNEGIKETIDWLKKDMKDNISF